MKKQMFKVMFSALMVVMAAASAMSFGADDAQAKPKSRKPSAKIVKKKTVVPPAPAVVPEIVTNLDLTPVTPDEPRGPYIEEAPTDDFERVAWCYGALSAHMELADLVREVSPFDPQIQAIGASYLRAYEAALTLSKKGETQSGQQKAETARLKGYESWSMARQARIEKAAWAYDTWQLPGECEQATVRLSGHDHIFAEMATEEEMDIIEATLTSSQQKVTELPAPKIKAQNAPEDPNAPVSTKRILIPSK